jgi:DNA-binding NarL/FixJ family response regulator
MRQPVRVVLADDHDAFAEGLGMVLSAEDDLEVVAVAGDGTAALQAVLAHQPDVLVARLERDDSLELLLCSLSERERQVLALLGRGYANRRIAEICDLSLYTVRTHVQNVLVRLGVHSKLEAAAIAVRHGLVHG